MCRVSATSTLIRNIGSSIKTNTLITTIRRTRHSYRNTCRARPRRGTRRSSWRIIWSVRRNKSCQTIIICTSRHTTAIHHNSIHYKQNMSKYLTLSSKIRCKISTIGYHIDIRCLKFHCKRISHILYRLISPWISIYLSRDYWPVQHSLFKSDIISCTLGKWLMIRKMGLALRFARITASRGYSGIIERWKGTR